MIERILNLALLIFGALLAVFSFIFGRLSKQNEINKSAVTKLKKFDKINNKRVSRRDVYDEEKW